MSNDKRINPNKVIDDGYLHAAAYKIATTVLDEYRAGFDMNKVRALPNAAPKSESMGSPVSVIRLLDGLTSRCKIPR